MKLSITMKFNLIFFDLDNNEIPFYMDIQIFKALWFDRNNKNNKFVMTKERSTSTDAMDANFILAILI